MLRRSAAAETGSISTGVDPRGARLGREEGQDAATGADVDDDVLGAHDGVDRLAEGPRAGLVL